MNNSVESIAIRRAQNEQAASTIPSLMVEVNYIDSSIDFVVADLSVEYAPPPLETHVVEVRDARAAQTSLDREGFEVRRHVSKLKHDPALIDANRTFSVNTPDISRAYQHEMLPMLEDIAQAREVMPFVAGLVVRFSDRHKDKTWQPAVNMVHIDMERENVHKFIEYAFRTEGRELRPYRRAVVYQVWQAISPAPHDSMVGFCDGRTVSADDTIMMDVIFGKGDTPADRFFSRGVKYNPAHQWYYFPDLQDDEVIVFKGYDTAMGDTMNLAHSAFDNPAGGIPRNSIEGRFIALYD